MRILLLVCLALSCFGGVCARDAAISLARREVKLHSGDIFITNTLSIQNNSADTCTYFITTAPQVQIFNAAPVTVPPGTTLVQPLKFMLPKTARGNESVLPVYVTSSNGDTIQDSFTLLADVQRDVYINITSQEPEESRSRLAVFIRNRGNVTEKLHLHSSDVLLHKGQLDLPFLLAPYADTTIYLLLNKGNTHYNADASELFLYDDNGAVVTSATILHTLQDNILRGQLPQVLAADNFASVQMNSIGNNYSFREYQLSYNRNGLYNGPILAGYAFEHGGGSPLSVTNSYAGYRYNAAMVRAGTLNLFGELPVYGQGAEISLGDQQRYIRAAYLFNSNAYLTWDGPKNTNNTRNVKADMAYPVSDKLSGGISFLREWDNPFYRDVYLAGTAWNWHPEAGESIEAALYASNGTTAAGDRNGWAGHVKGRYSKGHWLLLSDNYYSTPGYTGLLSNTQQFTENGTYYFSGQRKNAGISLRASYMDFNSTSYGYSSSRQVNNQYGAALFKTFGAATVSLFPFYTQQESQFNSSNSYSLNGWFASADVQYQRKSVMLSANIITPFHKDQTNEISSAALPLRVQLQAQYKCFFLQGMYQSQAFYATDTFMESAAGKAYYVRNISPGINIPCLNNMLHISASYNLQYLDNAADPYQYGYVSILFQPLLQWQLTASGAYNWNGLYQYKDVRVGVRFLFRKPSDAAGRKRTLVFFNDKNHNGLREAGEKAVKGIILARDAQTAISDGNGRIKVLHYRPAQNELALVNGNGYSLLNDLASCRLRKRKTYVPLYKLGVISGTITVKQDKFRRQPAGINGLPLVFVNEAGRGFTCYVLPDGTFSVSLPAGVYTVKVRNDLSDMYQLQQPEPLAVKEEQHIACTLNVTCKYTQPVEIIHFSGKK